MKNTVNDKTIELKKIIEKQNHQIKHLEAKLDALRAKYATRDEVDVLMENLAQGVGKLLGAFIKKPKA